MNGILKTEILNLEVLISDQSQQDSGPFSPVISRRGFGIGSIVRKAASVASVAAKHAYAAAAATPMNSHEEMLPLKCCLMSISLPWEYIAHDLLFKVNLCSPIASITYFVTFKSSSFAW